MALVVGAIIVLAALSLAFELSRGKSAKRKYMVWGITTMLPIAFVFSWLVALLPHSDTFAISTIAKASRTKNKNTPALRSRVGVR
ncbi:hypothetical protein [Paenibacillus cineris]|uniref:Cardiolipin synthase N-terminal domain-containing protein n=1 Tax=Paenibacillus cineris TaxID=237530 RepID=A0ABQ4LHS5_9BACL|nr:hypothetical protein [Paenibacillus cineris]GIO55997.1 hypothetical protein J21TS7_43150 [Paenibacillus cineris]